MLNKLDLSDYQLWMCQKIKEKLTQASTPRFQSEFDDREVVSIALSEMLLRLDVKDYRLE